jgi:hypothetical protein
LVQGAAQGECDGFYYLELCYRGGIGCEEDEERAKEIFWLPLSLRMFTRWMVFLGEFLDKDNPQRFVWFGRAVAKGQSSDFLNEMSDQIPNFNSGTGHAKVIFAIGRAWKGHINNEKRTIFGNDYKFDSWIGPTNQALRFY